VTVRRRFRRASRSEAKGAPSPRGEGRGSAARGRAPSPSGSCGEELAPLPAPSPSQTVPPIQPVANAAANSRVPESAGKLEVSGNLPSQSGTKRRVRVRARHRSRHRAARSRHAPAELLVRAPSPELVPRPPSADTPAPLGRAAVAQRSEAARLGSDRGKGRPDYPLTLPATGKATLADELLRSGYTRTEACQALLDLPALAPDPLGILPRRVDWRWRSRAVETLRRAGELGAAAALDSCRTWGVAALDRHAQMRGIVYHCNQRSCRTCQPHRTRGTRRRAELALRGVLERGDARRLTFGTLTLPGRWEAGAFRLGYETLNRTLYHWRRLPEVARHIRGALVAIEHPWSHESSRWHWHAHVLADADYWPSRATCEPGALCARCERQADASEAALGDETSSPHRRAWHRARLARVRAGCGRGWGWRDSWEEAFDRHVTELRGRAVCELDGEELDLGSSPAAHRLAELERLGCTMAHGFIYSDVRQARVAKMLAELGPSASEAELKVAIGGAVEEVVAYALKGDEPPAFALLAFHRGSERIQRYRWLGDWRGLVIEREAQPAVFVRLTSLPAWVSGRTRYVVEVGSGRRLNLPLPPELRIGAVQRARADSAHGELAHLARVIRSRRRERKARAGPNGRRRAPASVAATA